MPTTATIITSDLSGNCLGDEGDWTIQILPSALRVRVPAGSLIMLRFFFL
jgi:hypothetical protein